jgi:hypothetical protein
MTMANTRPLPSGPPGLKRRAFVGAAALVAGGRVALAQDRIVSIPFAPTATGLPEGFSVARTGKGAPAVWKAMAGDGPDGSVLTQTSTDETDYRFPLAIYDPLSALNLEATVRFRAVAGRIDRAGGLVVRLADPDNYYVVRANALEDNVNFYRVIQGVRQEIKGATVKVPSDVWHSLGLAADGERFTITFNDRALFTVTDRTLRAAGRVALWTKADSVTEFSALKVAVRP